MILRLAKGSLTETASFHLKKRLASSHGVKPRRKRRSRNHEKRRAPEQGPPAAPAVDKSAALLRPGKMEWLRTPEHPRGYQVIAADRGPPDLVGHLRVTRGRQISPPTDYSAQNRIGGLEGKINQAADYGASVVANVAPVRAPAAAGGLGESPHWQRQYRA